MLLSGVQGAGRPAYVQAMASSQQTAHGVVGGPGALATARAPSSSTVGQGSAGDQEPAP